MTILRTDIVSGIGGRNAIDGSVFFSETNDRLSVPNSADVRVGSDDFTIEAWIRVENPGDWTTVIGMWDSSAGRRTYALQRKKADSKLYFYVSADGGSTIGATNTQFASGGDVKLGEWHHVAGVRDGNTIRAYLNGVEVGNASFTASILNNTTDALFIGDTEVTAGGEAFNGYMSNVRLIKGTCLYPSGTTFTPPTSKLTAVDGTVLLCCQDSDDPTQEATGKTITGYANLIRTASELTAGELTSSNYSSAGSDWSFSNGVATVSMSSGGYETLGSVESRLVNGQLYELVVNVTTFNAGKFTFGQANAGNADFTIALGRNVFIHRYTGTTQDSGGIALYARDATGGGYAINFLSLKQVISGKAPKVLPPVGVDEGVTFEGDTKVNTQGYMYFPTGDTSQRGRGRAAVGGGYDGSNIRAEIEYYNIQSQGTTIDFGSLTTATFALASNAASSTRGIIAVGGRTPTYINTIEYITIATTSNATDFGDLNNTHANVATSSNQTRGICFSGRPASNVIEYITIASV